MKKTADPSSENGKIRVLVSDFPHGLREFEDIRLIRIKSSDYTLLIMEDHFPVLGQVEGTVELVSGEDAIKLGNIHGFYVHRDNECSLLVEDYLAQPAQEAADEN